MRYPEFISIPGMITIVIGLFIFLKTGILGKVIGVLLIIFGALQLLGRFYTYRTTQRR